MRSTGPPWRVAGGSRPHVTRPPSVTGADDGVATGAEINDVTRGGEKCTTYVDCLGHAEAGTNFDYDGVSGALEFRDEGEPTQASILIVEFDETGTIIVTGAVQGSVEA